MCPSPQAMSLQASNLFAQYDFTEALAKVEAEMIAKIIAHQQARFLVWDALTRQNLPVPPDLHREIDALARPYT